MGRTYTQAQVEAGANAAAEAVSAALGGLTPERQALVDLMVNAMVGFVDGGPETDLAEVVAGAYDESLDTVIGWIQE